MNVSKLVFQTRSVNENYKQHEQTQF